MAIQCQMLFMIFKWMVCGFGLVSLFNGISNFVGYLTAKLFSLKNSSWEDKNIHTFPKGICLKVNVIARLEFEFAYYDSVVHHFNYYTMRTPPELCVANSFVFFQMSLSSFIRTPLNGFRYCDLILKVLFAHH